MGIRDHQPDGTTVDVTKRGDATTEFVVKGVTLYAPSEALSFGRQPTPTLGSRLAQARLPGGGTRSESQVEHKLATLDGVARPDPATLRAYEAALNSLEPKCHENRELLGSMALKARDLLANGGVRESLLSILQHVDQSIPPGPHEMPCRDTFAGYVALRGGRA